MTATHKHRTTQHQRTTTWISPLRLHRRVCLLSLCAAASCVFACAPGDTPTRAAKVVLIGIDGFDPDIATAMMDEGHLPTFAALRTNGTFGRLRSREPLLSPLVWTSIATGRTPQDHGILDFVEGTDSGDLIPITSRRRQVPALWNISTAAGLVTGFLGWYATFPAEQVRGFQISDRIGFHQVRSATATTGVTFPEPLAAKLSSTVGQATIDIETTRDLFVAANATLSADGAERIDKLARIHATAELFRRATPELLDTFDPDLFGIYFELVDACSHLFMENAGPKRPSTSTQDSNAFAGTVARCYQVQDQILGSILASLDSDTTVMVVSDHGFKSGDARPLTSGRADTGVAGLWHRLDGVLFMRGPGIKQGVSITGAGILDIAPTVLALLGLPASPTMTGAVLLDAFDQAPSTDRHVDYQRIPARSLPRSEVSSHLAGANQDEAGATADQEWIAKLQALGYLNGGGNPVIGRDGRTASSYVNEGTSLAVDGEVDAALRAYSTAASIDPANPIAAAFASRLLIDRGDLEQAQKLLRKAAQENPESIFVHLELARYHIAVGRWGLAANELVLAESLDSNLAQLHLSKARLANVQGLSAQALVALDEAARLSDAGPMLAEILLLRARVAAEAGELDMAFASLDRARALKVSPEALAPAEADIALSQGNFEEALRLLSFARENSPGDVTVARKLAQALAATGSPTGAQELLSGLLSSSVNALSPLDRSWVTGDLALIFQARGQDSRVVKLLESALERRDIAVLNEAPRAANLLALLGAAHGRLGNLHAARDAYEQSVALEEHPLALKTLALLVNRLDGDRDRAVALLKRSLQLLPGQRDVEQLLADLGQSH